MPSGDAATIARIAEDIRLVRERLTAIEQWQAGRGDAKTFQQLLQDVLDAYALIGQSADVIGVLRDEIMALREWREARISGEMQYEQANITADLAFVTKQIAPILQGTRDDLVLMRKDLRELRAAIELALSQLP